ncbi:MAG: hypothetical protein MMC23_000767 [Stictis urceolatum]|nr:hypothetical protein [Stictis urceolata]
MPRPAYSIDLPSPKQFDDENDDYGDNGSLYELHDFEGSQDGGSQAEPRAGQVPPPASWRTMPHKGQLAILSLSRFADFFQMACLQAIMFHQLRSFDESAPDSTISWQAGILQGSFTAAQTISAFLWGRIADHPRCGRKRVLLMGFVGTSIACMGVAFARSFAIAMLWRFVAGIVDGTLGAARTMVAETVEKKFHSRAFLLLPLAFNIANILGPLSGGLLAQPLVNLAGLFGPNSLIGGKNGVSWMGKYPFAPPNLLSAAILLVEAVVIFFGLVETLESRRYKRDAGVEFTETLKRRLPCRRRKRLHYTRLSVNDALIFEATSAPENEEAKVETQLLEKPKLSFTRIWTANVLTTLLANSLFHFHLGAFATLWPSFLSTSHHEFSEPSQEQRPSFMFTGGLSFAPKTVGLAMAILGFIGVILQLVIYPRVDQRFGVVASVRYAMLLFPIGYSLAPYLALIPESNQFALWLGISFVLLLQVTAQTFTVPGMIILTNNCSPHPSVLATIHGVGQSTAAASLTLGSFLAGKWFAVGLDNGVVGTAWWAVAGVSAIAWVSSLWTRNGTGHEIKLAGEMDSEQHSNGDSS